MSSGAVPNLSVTADMAARNVALAQRRQRTQRRLPSPPPTVVRFAEENQIYIHNVGPWEHKVMLGSWGTYLVPACPKGQDFISGPSIPGIYHEPIPVNESNFQLESVEGSYVADQIIGVGKNLSPRASLVPKGVFKSTNRIPTEEEKNTAKDLLFKEFKRLFDEADIDYSMGEKKFLEVVGDEGMKHKLAAEMLGRHDARWVQNANLGTRVACRYCGTFIAPGVPMCPQCHQVNDVEAYAAMQASDKRRVAELVEQGEIKRGPGRPPNPKPVI